MKKHLLTKTFLFLAFLIWANVGWAQNTPTNWTGDTDIDIYQETTDPHGGSNCARISVKTGTQANCDFNNLTSIPVTAGNTFTVSYWYKTSPFVKGRVMYTWTGAAVSYSTAYTNANATSWTQFTEAGTVPAGATAVTISIRFYDQTGYTTAETQYIDDLTFETPTGTGATVTNGTLETWPTYSSILKAYTVSNTAIDLVYDGTMISTTPAEYNLTGTTAITFTTATIDGTNNKLLHLTGASATITGDLTLDNIADANTNLNFYAGVTPIANTSMTNAGGKIANSTQATFIGIVSANDANNNVWISDAASAYNGVLIYDGSFDALVAVGDEIRISATLTQYTNLTELTNPVLIEKISTGNTPYGPSVITGSIISAATTIDTDPAESWEGQLVKIADATITSALDATNYYYTASDDAGTTTFRIGDAVNYRLTGIALTLNSHVSIVGVVDYEDGAYRINPRSISDILSADATISSGVYTVAGFEISNIASSTSVATFKSNLTPATNATFEVYESDGTTPATTMATGNKVIVTAQDGITTATYNVTLNAPRSDKDITAYSIGAYVGVITDPVIDVVIGFADDLSTVVSTFTLSGGASAAIGATPQVSGVTINDFTSGTLVYTVTAEDLTTKDWTINVTKAAAPSSEKDIISYSVEGIDATIDGTLHTVTAEVLYSTSLTALVATFELSPYASATVLATPQVSATTANDFTAPVVYTVTAEDASTQDWTVTITNAPASNDATLSDLTIDGTTVTGFVPTTFTYNVVLPYGTTAVPAVVAFENNAFANAVVTPATNVTGTEVERTATVDVTAEDLTTTETYTIIFSVAPEAGILIFSEYIEGTSNNRAFEIYNPNATAVDLSQYTVKQSHNGTGYGVDGIAYVLPLEGTLAANDVYVIANNGALAGVLAVADTALVYSDLQGQKMGSFTGDDGLGLFRNGVLVDVIGQESIGPWDVAGITTATVNYTLIRKFGTLEGNTDWTASAGTDVTNSEWIVNALDDISNIGLPSVYVNQAPEITAVTLDPTNPTTSDDVVVSATITDDLTAAEDIEAYLYWGIVDGEEDTELNFLQVGFTDVFSATIPASTAGTIYYVIEAFDGELYSEEYGSYSITVGINNPDAIVSMNVFPNPSNGQFTLEMNAQKAGTFNVEIVNISGQVVFEKQIVQDGIFKSAIDISNSAKGVYYIRINDGTSVNVQKIVIQ